MQRTTYEDCYKGHHRFSKQGECHVCGVSENSISPIKNKKVSILENQSEHKDGWNTTPTSTK